MTPYEKRKQTMLLKYGSEEAVRALYQDAQKKSVEASTGALKGFAYLAKHNPEKLTKISTQGARAKHEKNKITPQEG